MFYFLLPSSFNSFCVFYLLSPRKLKKKNKDSKISSKVTLVQDLCEGFMQRVYTPNSIITPDTS